MKCPHTLMGEDLQVRVLGIRCGALHGIVVPLHPSVAVAFFVPIQRASRDIQVPG